MHLSLALSFMLTMFLTGVGVSIIAHFEEKAKARKHAEHEAAAYHEEPDY